MTLVTTTVCWIISRIIRATKVISSKLIIDDYSRSVRFTKTIEPGDKTAVRVFNNDVINKNTAVRFTWFQPKFQNSFETF